VKIVHSVCVLGLVPKSGGHLLYNKEVVFCVRTQASGFGNGQSCDTLINKIVIRIHNKAKFRTQVLN